MGGHFLLQGIFPTQRLNPSLLSILHWQVAPSPLSPRKAWQTCASTFSCPLISMDTRGGCEAHLHFTDEESEGPSGDGLAGEQRRDVGPGLPDAGL